MGEMLKYHFVSSFLSKGNNFLDVRAKDKISTGPMEPMSLHIIVMPSEASQRYC